MRCVPALLLLTACGPSPQPLPPPIIERTKLSITQAAPMTLEVRGAPGAIRNEADTVDVVDATNLALVGVPVAADGSFTATLPAELTDSLRLQAFVDDRRSQPIDVVADAGGGVLDAPRIACAVLEPPLDLDLPETVVAQRTSADVIVHNQCPGILSVDEALLQTDPLWEVTGMIPADLMPGDQLAISVMRNPPGPGVERNYLRLRLADGTGPELRLVTVHVIVR